MRLFRNECEKTLLNPLTLTLFVILCIANAILFHFWETGKGLMYRPEDYKEIYGELEGKEAEEIFSFLQQKGETEEIRTLFLTRAVKSEVTGILGYDAYVSNIVSAVDDLRVVSIFRKEDSFSLRSAKKLAEVYGALPKIETKVNPVRGVVMATQFGGTDLLVFVFLMYIVFSMAIREKEMGQLLLTRTTLHGHARHGFIKILVCGVACLLAVSALEATNLIMASQRYGLGDLGRSIQSVPEYQACIFPVSVGEFLVLLLLFKIFVLFLLSVLVFFMASASNSLVKFTLLFMAVFGTEGILYFAISGNSYLSLLKYLNLFAVFGSHSMLGNYLNLNFFGRPVWYLPVYLSIAGLLLLLFGGLGVWAYAACPGTGAERKTGRRIRLFPEKTVSLFIQECYKLLYCEKVIWILAGAVLFQVVTYQPMREFFANQEDAYFKQYMLLLEGPYGEDKERLIREEQERYDELTRKMQEAIAANPAFAELIGQKYQEDTRQFSVLPKLHTHAAYLKEKKGAFLYDTGYRILTNDEIGKADNNGLSTWANLLMILCTGFLFSTDYQVGMNYLQRATVKGRKELTLRKVLVGTLVLTVIFALLYVPFYFNVLTTYGTRGMMFPACSMAHLQWCPAGISILGYLGLMLFFRFVFLFGKMILMFLIAAKVKSSAYTVVICAGLYITPLLLYYFR